MRKGELGVSVVSIVVASRRYGCDGDIEGLGKHGQRRRSASAEVESVEAMFGWYQILGTRHQRDASGAMLVWSVGQEEASGFRDSARHARQQHDSRCRCRCRKVTMGGGMHLSVCLSACLPACLPACFLQDETRTQGIDTIHWVCTTTGHHGCLEVQVSLQMYRLPTYFVRTWALGKVGSSWRNKRKRKRKDLHPHIGRIVAIGPGGAALASRAFLKKQGASLAAETFSSCYVLHALGFLADCVCVRVRVCVCVCVCVCACV
ncbi:hypothetical protein LX36DRAFT_271303 [Colletotrichum falcatum]|nr:hypothetical protein LX36DRAFT_271303 [Colletotrichum falcatum]